MGYLCDFCGEKRSVVYCRSDAASLCLSCDCTIHSANALSRRHSRTLVCERCNSEPASVRCIEEKISLCQSCDWVGHSGSMSPSHKREAVNCYSGCPSSSELSSVWPFIVINSPSVEDSIHEQEIGNIQGEGSGQHNVDFDKSVVWMESLTPLLDPGFQNVEQPTASTSSAVSKVLLSGERRHVLSEDDGRYDNLDMDEVELGIENYEELFSMPLDNPKNIFGDDGIIGTNAIQPACSNAASADSVISSKTEPNLCFARQAYSFSGLTGENNGLDFQDCGISSMAIAEEPTWYPKGPESSGPSTTRTNAVMRYKEKKKARKFEKKVRYESRKARADVRRRVKGRFVKSGEAYDYDPLSPSKSY